MLQTVEEVLILKKPSAEYHIILAIPLKTFAHIPGPEPQMATLSPLPTRPNSFACHAVGKMSDNNTTCSSVSSAGTFKQFRSAAHNPTDFLLTIYCPFSHGQPYILPLDFVYDSFPLKGLLQLDKYI